MENEIGKLICEYQNKTQITRDSLGSLKTKICVLRRSGKHYTSERKDQAALFAKLNAYMQAEVDIESLLDHVVTNSKHKEE